MSWGTELWDQFENILVHAQKGIDLCEKFSQFTKERCSIEIDYANKLKKLVKSHLPKKKEDDELTTSNGFLAMIKEVNDIAGQHETISESLLASVFNENQNLIQELKQERKKTIQDGSKHQSTLQAQFALLEKVKKASERAFKELEKAQEAYKKASDDHSMARNEIDRAKQTLNHRQQGFEQSKHDYAAEVQKTNKAQKDHYHVLMPQVFTQLQTMDERRIAKVKGFIMKTAETERSSIPIINRCIDGIIQAASIVDYNKEMQLVIDKYKTGFSIPSDVPFEDVSSSNYNKSMNNIYGTVSGSMSIKKGDKKRPGLLAILSGPKDDAAQKEDFSHLPPIQQKRQLTAKIDSLKTSLAKETSERDALFKMQDVYQRNASLGDPVAVARQLEDKTQKLHQLGCELKKYEEYMMEAKKRLAAESGATTNANDSSHSEPVHGIIQMTSEPAPSSSSKVKGKPATPTKPTFTKTPDSATPSKISLVEIFPSGPPNRRKSLTPQQDSFDNASDDEFMDGGSCTALYDFDGSADGSVAMKTGQEFTIVARDEGDGWIHVMSSDGRRGFVPATYVKYND